MLLKNGPVIKSVLTYVLSQRAQPFKRRLKTLLFTFYYKYAARLFVFYQTCYSGQPKFSVIVISHYCFRDKHSAISSVFC